MARPLRWLLTFVVLLTAGMVNAQVPTEIKGTWLVEVNDNNRPRTMVVTEEQNAVRVLFGFAGEKLSTIPAKLTDRGELTATTLFGSVMVLNSKGADRLEGSFTPKTGKVFVAQASRTNASETVSAVAVPTAKAAATHR